MFGWFRKSKPPALPAAAPMFDPDVDLDVEATPGMQFRRAKAPQPASAVFQEIDQLDPEDEAINEQACRQAQQEIIGLIRQTGVTLSAKEQHDRMLGRAIEIRGQLVMFKRMVEEVREAQEDLRTDLRDMKVRQNPRTSVDQLADFWREHPFLVGFFGAELMHKINKALAQR